MCVYLVHRNDSIFHLKDYLLNKEYKTKTHTCSKELYLVSTPKMLADEHPLSQNIYLDPI